MHGKYDRDQSHLSKSGLLIFDRRDLTAIEADILDKVAGMCVPRAFNCSKVTIYGQILTDF